MGNSSKNKGEGAAEAYLILADKTVYTGRSLGAEGTSMGEVVFTTGMTAYQETLTDPSYYGQLITQTFPLIGNYGLNDADKESAKIWAKGYIVREACKEPSNFRSKYTLDEYLKAHNIVGIEGIDTRALTRKIRECGVMNGAITTEMPQDLEGFLQELSAYEITDAVKAVSCRKAKRYNAAESKYHVILYDYGYKANILRSLRERGCDVTVVPYNTSLAEIKTLKPDGIMLSNGPGDPAENTEPISILRELMKLDLPVFGICLGHQLLALANNAKTAKLKYGHRGANQPVVDVNLDRVFVTSQNHGYAVLGDTLPGEVGYVSHYSANDKSCEGIAYSNKRAFTVQFHPEACGGPQDTQYLFDKFIALLDEKK